MTDDPIITINDLRRVGLCARGVRRWCQRHDIDFAALVRDGARLSEIEKHADDGMIAFALKRLGGDDGRRR